MLFACTVCSGTFIYNVIVVLICSMICSLLEKISLCG